MLFVDTDVEFDETSLLTMLEADKDIVLTPYPMKVIDWDKAKSISEKSGRHISKCGYYYPMSFVDPENIDCSEGITEIKRGPAGFMLIKRQVFERMMLEYPELHYKNDSNIDEKIAKYCYAFFDTHIDEEDRRYLSEDYRFCRLWQKLGGEIWLDPKTKLNHIGTYTFEGNVDNIISVHGP